MKKSPSASLGQNAIYKGILNAFNLLVPLFVGPYIAGLLSPELYGIYNRVYAEFNVFFVIGSFGIYNYGIREISKVRQDPVKFSQIFSSLFVIGVIANCVVTVFYIIYFSVRSTGIDFYVYAVMIIQMASNVFYIEFINEATENYRFITIKTIIIRFLYFISIFAFVRRPTDVIIYSIVVSMTAFLNNFVSFTYIKRNVKFSFKSLQLKPHILPLIVTLLLANVEMLYGQLDKLLLSPFVSDIAVTEYTLPSTLVGMLCTLPLSLVTVAIPRLSYYIGNHDKDSYENTLHRTIHTYMAIVIPISIGILVLAKEIMWIYTKDVYTYVYPVLIVTALARIPFAYQSLISNLVMYINNCERQLTSFLLIFGLANVAFDFLLIWLQIFSPLTAMCTTAIAVALFDIITTRYANKHLHIHCNFFSRQIIGYFFISFLFIPISFIVHAFPIGTIGHIAFTIILCVCLYGAYLLYRRDPILDIIFKKLKKGS